MSFNMTDDERRSYQIAEERGAFKDLPDGQCVGLRGKEIVTGDWAVVFMILRRMVDYNDRNQSILIITKKGENLEFSRHTRQNNKNPEQSG